MNGYYQNGQGIHHKDSASKGSYVTQNDANFLKDLFKIIVTESVQNGTSRENKVIDFKYPDDLKNVIDFSVPEDGVSKERLLDICRDTIKYSVKSGHPHFFNTLFAGLDVNGFGGACLTESLNTCGYTFEMAPVFSLIEEEVVNTCGRLIGFDEADGIFTPGGSFANIFGMNLARFHKFPEVKSEGMFGLPRMCVFTSKSCHYSVSKGASLMGLGSKGVRAVPTDDRDRMSPSHLDAMITEAINAGEVPIMVNATVGTTVSGSFDDLDAIADVCSRHNVWLHADGAVGGTALFSSKHRHLLHGVARVDSMTWDFHKMGGAPQQCAVFITKHIGMLTKCHSSSARYIFQQDKLYDASYDSGDKTIQCGRKVDAFKIWLMLKAKGLNGFEMKVDQLFDIASYMTESIRNRDGFRLVWPNPQGTNVSFWYIPPSMRGQNEDESWWEALGKVAPLIRKRMSLKGSMMIGYQPASDKVNFFRIVFANYQIIKTDIDFVVSELEHLGSDITLEDF